MCFFYKAKYILVLYPYPVGFLQKLHAISISTLVSFGELFLPFISEDLCLIKTNAGNSSRR